jgi:biopolymer transport protein ExbD/biopolymer transport protein TolR
MDVGAESGGKRKKRGARPAMNVTPLVDVVLVLLIIFMVVTPLLSKQFWLNVPKKEEKQEPQPQNDDNPPVVLQVTAEGKIKVGPDEVADADLAEKLKRVFAARNDHTLFFGAAPDVPFGRAMEAMDIARGGGAVTIAVMTEPLAR